MIIITVNFNKPEFLEVQLPLIQRNLQPLAIHVINTGDKDNGCKEIAAKFDAKYTFIEVGTKDFSQSHAVALSVGYAMNRQLTDIIGILDHDCFPFLELNIREAMGDKTFFSSPQIRRGRLYPNPACMFFKTSVGDVDFMPCDGMDTAGQLYKVYVNVRQMYYEGFMDYEVFAKSFLHIVKGSNWVNTAQNKIRVDRVFEQVKKFL